MSTIYAVSSGILPSAIAVVRVSGPETLTILKTFLGKIPPSRQMVYQALTAKNGDILDHALTVYFPAPHSFTGEECAEFHLHGGKAVVARFLQELSQFPQTILARPGEFSRRAFLNGQFDLTQAEGLADLIHAETESQRQLALREADGGLSEKYKNWRELLIKIRAFIEAELDFSEEDDVEEGISQQLMTSLASLYDKIEKDVILSERGALLRDGLKIVFMGAPNSGKSSLMNLLTGRAVSIISDEAGTTRDAIESRLILAGIPIYLIDTAGIRTAETKIEKIGIDLAFTHLQQADLILHIEDMHAPQSIELPNEPINLWRIGNKKDLVSKEKTTSSCWDFEISALTGEGIAELLEKISVYGQEKMAEIGNFIPARARHLTILKQVLAEFSKVLDNPQLALEIKSEHLRHASQLLGQLTGDVDVEDLLDIIFSEFCIGK